MAKPEWSLSSWLASLPGVTDAIVSAIAPDDANDDPFEYARTALEEKLEEKLAAHARRLEFSRRSIEWRRLGEQLRGQLYVLDPLAHAWSHHHGHASVRGNTAQRSGGATVKY